MSKSVGVANARRLSERRQARLKGATEELEVLNSVEPPDSL
jgi:hypothetical protein